MSKIKTIKICLWSVLLILVGITCLYIFSSCGTNNMVLLASKNATSYDIDAIYNDETKTLFATENINFVNSSDGSLSNVCLHLYPNAFRQDAINKPVSSLNEEKAYPNGFSSGSIEIKNAQVSGKKVAFEIGGEDKNILVLPLANTLPSQSKIDILIEFSLTIPNIAHRFGWTENAVNLGNWYPIVCAFDNGKFATDCYNHNGDPFFSTVANYSVSINLDDDFVVASTGYKTNEKKENGKQILTFNALAVRDFALIFSKKFNTISQTQNGVKIQYFYYDDEQSQKSLQTCCDAISTFDKLFGDYPYNTLSVVKTSFVHGGMEYPNLVYISDSVENYDEYTNVIVHEIAHQWWYGVVGNNEITESWIDEGLAEYSTTLFYDNNEQYGIQKDIVIRDALNSYLLFIDVYKDIYKEVDTTMTRSLNQYKTEPEYTYMSYVKSLLMFDSLENLVGTQKMISSLKTFYKQNSMRIATRQTLVSAFEQSCNTKLENFFSSWLDGKIVIENP